MTRTVPFLCLSVTLCVIPALSGAWAQEAVSYYGFETAAVPVPFVERVSSETDASASDTMTQRSAAVVSAAAADLQIPDYVPSRIRPANPKEAESAASVFQDVLASLAYFERELRLNGYVIQDTALVEYVRAVGRKVTPETYPGRIEINIVLDPSLNAFALPNGSIYVHLGLLARLENEAQLAQVLGHEISHVTLSHTEEYYRALRSKTHFAELLALAGAVALQGNSSLANALFGVGLNLLYAASVNGFGRSSEQEADDAGLALMLKAGYDSQEAPRTFEILQKEYGDPGKIENFFYGSHPRNEERVKYLRQTINKKYSASGGDRAFERFQTALAGHYRTDAQLNLEQGWPLQALASLDRIGDSGAWDAELWAHFGEAHRLWAKHYEAIEKWKDKKEKRGKRTKREEQEKQRNELYEKAQRSFEQALRMDPARGETHRRLSALALDRGDTALAVRSLIQYQQLNPSASDSMYVSWKILRLSGDSESPETKEELKARKKALAVYHTRFIRGRERPRTVVLLDPSVSLVIAHSGGEGVLDEGGVYAARRTILRNLHQLLKKEAGQVRAMFREHLGDKERYLYHRIRMAFESELGGIYGKSKTRRTDGFGVREMASQLDPTADVLVIPLYYGATLSGSSETKEMFKTVAIAALTGAIQMTVKAQALFGVGVVDVRSGEIYWCHVGSRLVYAQLGKEQEVSDPALIRGLVEETFIYPGTKKR